MSPGRSLLLQALQPAALLPPPTDLASWDLLVRLGKATGLLARLHATLPSKSDLAALPAQPRRHLDAARAHSNRQHELLHWEIHRLHRALYPLGIPVVLLKGAAYVATGLPAARGRFFADMDILVPGAALASVERELFLNGWVAEKLDAYDQRYYRQWMHELPPLRHIKRQSVLDLHHTILPPTARLKPDPRKLLKAAIPVADYDDFYVLCPTDMVLHSATHLFHDGELEHGLRDIVDLDDLVRHFSARDPGFWDALVDRAFEMDLAQPLFYGLRYAQRMLETPVPEAVSKALDKAGPGPLMRPVMDALFKRGLAPHHPSCDDWFSPAARWLLYVRSHYLRMPLRLLIPHLVRKALHKRFEPDNKALPAQQKNGRPPGP